MITISEQKAKIKLLQEKIEEMKNDDSNRAKAAIDFCEETIKNIEKTIELLKKM